MATEMKKTRVKMIKPLYLGMSILDISKTLMYENWYDYIGPKYGGKAKLCFTDIDSFIINIKTKYFFEDISNDVERWFDRSNYDQNDKRPLPIGMNKKLPGLFKDELGGKIITEVAALRPKTYAYLTNDDIETKKAKGTKKYVIKQKLSLQITKFACLIIKQYIDHRKDLEAVTMSCKQKIALSSNHDKRLQTFDEVQHIHMEQILLKYVKVKC